MPVSKIVVNQEAYEGIRAEAQVDGKPQIVLVLPKRLVLKLCANTMVKTLAAMGGAPVKAMVEALINTWSDVASGKTATAERVLANPPTWLAP